MKVSRKIFFIAPGIILLCVVILSGYIIMNSNTQSATSPNTPPYLTEVRDYTLHNTISFIKPIDYTKYQNNQEDLDIAMQKTYLEGGITFDEFLELNSMVNLIDNNLKDIEATLYYNSETVLSGVILSSNKEVFYTNARQKLQELNINSPDLTSLKITEIYFRTTSQDSRALELAYLFNINTDVEFNKNLKIKLDNAINSNNYSDLENTGLNISNPYNTDNYGLKRLKRENEEKTKRLAQIESCILDLYIQEADLKIRLNQPTWSTKKGQYTETISNLSNKIGSINSQGERTIIGCEQYHFHNIQIRFTKPLSISDIQEIENTLPLIYPKKYIAELDPDYRTNTTSTEIDILNAQFDNYEPEDYTYRDIDLITTTSTETSQLFALFNPGKNWKDMKNNYYQNRTYLNIPKDSVEKYRNDQDTIYYFTNNPQYTNLSTQYIDGVTLFTTTLDDQYLCLQQLLTSDNHSSCSVFSLNQSQKKLLQSYIKLIEITPVAPHTHTDLYKFEASPTSSFWVK